MAHAKTLGEPIVITALIRLEFENAVALLRLRGAMPEVEAATATTAFAANEAAGRITEAMCDWPGVMTEAVRISRARTRQEGHRLLDILHVAAALRMGGKEFLSFDQRQRELAAAEGLAVGPQR